MKVKKRWLVISLALLLIAFGYFFLFTSSSRPARGISIKGGEGLSQINNELNLPNYYQDQNLSYCSYIRKGCENYLNIIPATPEFNELNQEQRRCVTSGCVVWGIPETRPVSLDLTEEELTSLINDLKPGYLPISNIRLKITGGKVYAEGIIFLPPASGLLTLTLAPNGDKSLRVLEGSLGRIPLSHSVLYFLTDRINSLLTYNWYGSSLDSFKLDEGRIFIEARFAPELLSRIKKLLKKP